MADGIFINTGTGPVIAAESIGTAFLQRVKLAIGNVDTDSGDVSVSNPIPITGSGLIIASLTTGTMNVVNTVTVTAANITVASVTTGTMNVVNTVAISGTNTALQGGTWNIGTVTTLLGTVAVSGGGGGVQYGATTTAMGATATGNVIIGIQTGATTGVAMVITTTGGLIIGSMPAVGGGQQYQQSATSVAATGTGTLIMGIQSTTTWAVAITSSGQLMVAVANQPAITFVSTQAVTAANVTVASLATGTVNVVNVLSASGVTVASVATGTFSMSGTGTVLVANQTTGTNGGLYIQMNGTQSFPNRIQGYVAAITSAAAGVIIITSGANTIYVTDVMISVPSAMNVGLYSETTGPLAFVYLASNGGWAQSFKTPIVCTTGQSLRVILSTSGSCSVMAAGFTVT